jgi:hypothetical protein
MGLAESGRESDSALYEGKLVEEGLNAKGLGAVGSGKKDAERSDGEYGKLARRYNRG